MIHDISKTSQNIPGPPKPNLNPFAMTKINVTNSIIFVTDLIAMSHIDDIEDDVAADMVMTWMAVIACKLMWTVTWLLTWKVRLTWQSTWQMTWLLTSAIQPMS